jgi:hypothetical protein
MILKALAYALPDTLCWCCCDVELLEFSVEPIADWLQLRTKYHSNAYDDNMTLFLLAVIGSQMLAANRTSAQ